MYISGTVTFCTVVESESNNVKQGVPFEIMHFLGLEGSDNQFLFS